MKQDVTRSDFCNNKRLRENFSYEGLMELYDYLESVGNDDGDEYNLDVIELCCDFAEGEIVEVLESYNLKSIGELEENTIVVWYDKTRVLYAQY